MVNLLQHKLQEFFKIYACSHKKVSKFLVLVFWFIGSTVSGQ